MFLFPGLGRPNLRGMTDPILDSQLLQHFLRGELSFLSIRRSQCPTWRCSVALRADRRLQFSSRPPSPELSLVGFQKFTRVVVGPTYLCHQPRDFSPTVVRSPIRFSQPIANNRARIAC